MKVDTPRVRVSLIFCITESLPDATFVEHGTLEVGVDGSRGGRLFRFDFSRPLDLFFFFFFFFPPLKITNDTVTVQLYGSDGWCVVMGSSFNWYL